jgi:hypothetical protein
VHVAVAHELVAVLPLLAVSAVVLPYLLEDDAQGQQDVGHVLGPVAAELQHPVDQKLVGGRAVKTKGVLQDLDGEASQEGDPELFLGDPGRTFEVDIMEDAVLLQKLLEKPGSLEVVQDLPAHRQAARQLELAPQLIVGKGAGRVQQLGQFFSAGPVAELVEGAGMVETLQFKQGQFPANEFNGVGHFLDGVAGQHIRQGEAVGSRVRRFDHQQIGHSLALYEMLKQLLHDEVIVDSPHEGVEHDHRHEGLFNLPLVLLKNGLHIRSRLEAVPFLLEHLVSLLFFLTEGVGFEPKQQSVLLLRWLYQLGVSAREFAGDHFAVDV